MILKSLRYSHLTQVSLIQFFCCCLVIGAFRSEVDLRNEQVLGFTDLRILFSHVMEELCISQFQLRPSPPGQLRGICPSCHSRGWGISKFSAARGSGICLPRGYPRAFDTHVVSTRNPNMEDFVGKDLQFVADWLVRQGLDKLVEFY